MKISIAMASYNGGRHIAAQLRSFGSQTRPPDQLVICDDGSTDDTIAIVTAFAAEAPFEVVIHRNEVNLGYARNFLGAIRRCTGDLIFLSDQDDVWLDDKVATVAAVHEAAEEPLLTINNQEIADASMVRSGRTTLEQIRRHGRKDASFVHGCCTAFGAAFVPLLGDLPAGMAHDDWLHFLATRLGRRQVVPDVLQLYRRHSGATTSSVFNSSDEPDRWAPLAQATPKGSRAERQASLERRLRLLEEAGSRLEQANHRGWAPARLKRALDGLAQEAAAVRARLQLITGQRGRLAALAMLASGHYRHFDGLRSFVRDLLL